MKPYNVNQAVFTTKFILKQKKPVIYVYHNIDNDWQFLGSEPANASDLMIVTLGEILSYDGTLEDIMNLPEGYQALRDSKGALWEISKMEEDI